MAVVRIEVGASVLAVALALPLIGCGDEKVDRLSGWKRHFGPHAQNHALAVGADGRIAIAGNVVGPVDFGAAGVIEQSGSRRGFVAMLDESGQPIWTFATDASHPGDVAGFDAVTVDPAGNVFALGVASFGTNVGGEEVPPSGYVVALSVSGKPIWKQLIVNATGGYPFNPVNTGFDIAVDASGNVFVAAACFDAAKVGQIETSPPPIPHPGAWPYLCLFALDPQGAPRWGRAFTADWTFGTPRPKLVVGPNGHLYVAGHANNQMDLGSGITPTPGMNAAYVLALDAEGEVRWSRVFGGTIADGGSLAIDPTGRLVATVIGGGDVVIEGEALGGGAYVERSVLVWLDTDGAVLSRRVMSSSILFDTVAAGSHGLALSGTVGKDTYAPTPVAHCRADGTACRIADLGETWDLYRGMAWHPDGDFVAGGSYFREGNSVVDELSAVGKFRFE
ncbi:MAG: hypothetical protein AMXMBFR56_10560 [Polyangiaceae bacterium]